MSYPPTPSVQPHCASDERGFQRIRVRQDTADNWLKNDPVLASGEFGCVIGATDPGQTLKIGDGTVRWSQLPWLMATGNSGPPGPEGPSGPGPVVTEQETPPIYDTLKDGDVWLQPVSTKDGNEVATVDDLDALRRHFDKWVDDLPAPPPPSLMADKSGLTINDVEQVVRRLLPNTEVLGQIINITQMGDTTAFDGKAVEDYLNSLPDTRKPATKYDYSLLHDDLHNNFTALLNDCVQGVVQIKSDEFRQGIVDAVKMMLNGGKLPPPDIGWTECPKVAGAGLVEARLVNGTIQLRGSVTITVTSWTHVRNLPASFPKPLANYNTMTSGGEAGMAERVCQVSIRSNGQIHINSFNQKITSLDTFPATAPVT